MENNLITIEINDFKFTSRHVSWPHSLPPLHIHPGADEEQKAEFKKFEQELYKKVEAMHKPHEYVNGEISIPSIKITGLPHEAIEVIKGILHANANRFGLGA